MNYFHQLAMVSLLGLATTSSSLLGAAIGLYLSISKRLLACLLAFAAGSLISALAIELAYEGALSLHHQGFDARAAWAFVSSGFAVGAVLYYATSLFLEKRGAAVRYGTQFREYALTRKQQDIAARIKLLATSDLMRHLPAEQIERILPCIHDRQLEKGEILFRTGDPGDALYIVGSGKVEVLSEDPGAEVSHGGSASSSAIAVLGKGNAFGEMSLLGGDPRTATIRAVEDTDLLKIDKSDFERLVAEDPQMADAVKHISHRRAIDNLSAGGTNAARWAKVAGRSLDHLSRHETGKMLTERRRNGDRAGQHSRHHPRLPRHRRQVYRSRQPLGNADAGDVPGRHSGGGGECLHVDQGRLPPGGDFRPLVDRAADRHRRRRGRQGLHRQQRRAGGDLRPGAGGRRCTRTGRPCHDSRRPGGRRLAGGAPDGCRFSLCALSGFGGKLRLNPFEPPWELPCTPSMLTSRPRWIAF